MTARMRKFRRFHRSSLYQIADELKSIDMEKLETIDPLSLAPWEKRMQVVTDDTAATRAGKGPAVRIAVSSSARNGVVGMGGVIEIQTSRQSEARMETFATTLAERTEQNPYSGELAAMANALSLLPRLRYRDIVVMTRNKAVTLTLRRPYQQSGQQQISRIYSTIMTLRREGNRMTVVWLPSDEDNELLQLAKNKAKTATRRGATPHTQLPKMRSTTLNNARAKLGATRPLPEKVGSHSKRVDAALPGKHTRQLYDQRPWAEATILAQLRTGMNRLNTYLFRIGAVGSDLCECGQARETVEHFLFRCQRWTRYRTGMLQCTETQRSNISFYLGGKSPSDDKGWKPSMEAVKATIRFAMATGRLDPDQPRRETP